MRSEYNLITGLLRPFLYESTRRKPTAIHMYYVRSDSFYDGQPLTLHSAQHARRDVMKPTMLYLYRIRTSMGNNVNFGHSPQLLAQ